jgi:hypothetical protein
VAVRSPIPPPNRWRRSASPDPASRCCRAFLQPSTRILHEPLCPSWRAAQVRRRPLPARPGQERRHLPPARRLPGARLDRPVELRTVDSWEGLAKSLANGETDIALIGPWGYVLANHEAGAQAVSTILYDGKPEYFAIMVTHPGFRHPQRIADLKGRTFAFGDKGSTSGYLIPLHFFMTAGNRPGDATSAASCTPAPGDRDAGRAARARRRRRLQPQPQRDDRAGADQGRAVEDLLAPRRPCRTTPSP